MAFFQVDILTSQFKREVVMSQQLILQKHINDSYFGFLIDLNAVWESFQKSDNPRKAVIDYYQQLTPMSDSEGNTLLLDVSEWKGIAKELNTILCLHYPHLSRVLPSIPSPSKKTVRLLHNNKSKERVYG